MTPRIAVALALAAALAYALGRCDGRKQGAAETRIEQVLVERVRVDSVYVVRRDTLTRWLARWDTARVTDTVWRDSVVYVRRDVADSTIKACRATVASCDELRAKDQALIAELRAQKTPRTRLRDRVGLSVGYGVQFGRDRQLTHGVQVGVGIRVWP